MTDVAIGTGTRGGYKYGFIYKPTSLSMNNQFSLINQDPMSPARLN
jgi:hypothetical protein